MFESIYNSIPHSGIQLDNLCEKLSGEFDRLTIMIVLLEFKKENKIHVHKNESGHLIIGI